jgi:aquaporin Z
MKKTTYWRASWRLFISELFGTALLVLGGLSCVIVMFGEGSPVAAFLPDEGIRRAITGFLFGLTGALIAVSPVGRESGAHINPAVTLGFWLMGKLEPRVAIGYALAQMAGACLGVLPLLSWGSMGRSVEFGATAPGAGYSTSAALIGEAVTTFALIAGLCVFLGFRKLRPYTPALMPPLFSFMVYAEAPISGTSCNPARSFGPAIISGQWDSWWVYWVGPVIGTVAATLVCSFLAKRIEMAKVYRFDSDPHGLFRRMAQRDAENPGLG